jgi:hypothetical protein
MTDLETVTGGTDIVRISDAEVERALRGEDVALTIEDPRETARAIIDRILAATNADEVLGGQRVYSGRDCIQRPFTLHGVRWHRSRFEGGLPVFAVLDVEFADDGERAAITTSAGNVMAQAYALQKLGALPCLVMITEAEHETAQGYRPQWLVRA